jgi:inorganic triphosphatase YgiF
MVDNKEIEIKLLINTSEQFTAVIYHPLVNLQHEESLPYSSVYFDTCDRLLQIPKITYRVRKEGNVCIATIKTNSTETANGICLRNEWNVDVDSLDPNIECFMDLIPSVVSPYVGCKFVSIVTAAFARQTRVFQFNDSTIEIAADLGVIVANNKHAPIMELELELKGGSTDDLVEYSDILQHELNLSVGYVSKFKRGLDLWND